MDNKEYIVSVLNIACREIERTYTGCLAIISENIISREGYSYVIEVFNLKKDQLLELNNKQLEFTNKYYNRLGKLLIMEPWSEQVSMDYFSEKIEKIKTDRFYKNLSQEMLDFLEDLKSNINLSINKWLKSDSESQQIEMRNMGFAVFSITKEEKERNPIAYKNKRGVNFPQRSESLAKAS